MKNKHPDPAKGANMKDELEAVKKMSLADIEKELAKYGKPEPAKENPINGHAKIQEDDPTRQQEQPPGQEVPDEPIPAKQNATTTTGE